MFIHLASLRDSLGSADRDYMGHLPGLPGSAERLEAYAALAAATGESVTGETDASEADKAQNRFWIAQAILARSQGREAPETE